jgi:predicted DNA-binding protein YlxM (UPF0122 family)
MDFNNYFCIFKGERISLREAAMKLHLKASYLYDWVQNNGLVIDELLDVDISTKYIMFEGKLSSKVAVSQKFGCSTYMIASSYDKYLERNKTGEGFGREDLKYFWNGHVYLTMQSLSYAAGCSLNKVRNHYKMFGNFKNFDPNFKAVKKICRVRKQADSPVVWQGKTFSSISELADTLGYTTCHLRQCIRKGIDLNTLNIKDKSQRGRKGKEFIYNGKTVTIADLAEYYGVSRWSVEDHLRKGHDLNTVKWRRNYLGKVKVQYKNKIYNSIKHCADENNLSLISLYTWWRNNGKCIILDKYTERFNKYEYNGCGYKSIQEVAQAANTTIIAATKYYKTFGTFEGFHEKYYPVKKRIPLTYKGVKYKSVRECCLANGLDYNTSVARLRTHGKLERIRPEFRVEYDGTVYTSKKALADKLGCNAACITYHCSKYGNLDRFFHKKENE